MLAEALARELAAVYERLGEVYDGAFVETETQESLEHLVDELRPRKPWCPWPFRARRRPRRTAS
jgi:hypothetical protein